MLITILLFFLNKKSIFVLSTMVLDKLEIENKSLPILLLFIQNRKFTNVL